MAHYTKLWSYILTSTVWNEDDQTRIVWITMLALADMGGFVAGSIPGIGVQARVSLSDAERAINRLLSPDKYSRTEEHEGRRLQKVDGGWIILNYEKHREAAAEEIRRSQNRDRQSKFRKNRQKRNAKSNGVTRYVTQSNAPSRPSASASASEASSSPPLPLPASVRTALQKCGVRMMDDDTCFARIKTPAEVFYEFDRIKGKSGVNDPAAVLAAHFRNSYAAPALIPSKTALAWMKRSGFVRSVNGVEIAGKVGISTGDVICVGEYRILPSLLTPESFEFNLEVE